MAVDSAVAPGSYVLYENEQVAEIRVRGEVSIPSVSDNNIQVFFARWRKGPPGQALLADTSLAGIASKTGDRASPVTITLRRMTQGPPRVLYGYLAVGPQSKFVRVYSE